FPYTTLFRSSNTFPVRRNRVQQSHEIGRPDDVHSGGIQIGGKSNTCQSGIAAVGAAQNADALGISDSFGNKVLHAPGDVVLHLSAPLMIAGIEKFLAVTRGTAKVGHQYHIATICEELSQRVVAPVVA